MRDVQLVAAVEARSCAGRQNTQMLARTHAPDALCAPLAKIRSPDGDILAHSPSIAGEGGVLHLPENRRGTKALE